MGSDCTLRTLASGMEFARLVVIALVGSQSADREAQEYIHLRQSMTLA